MSLRRPLLLIVASTLTAAPWCAQAAAIGRLGGPYIGGPLREGDFAQVQREWAQERFDRPVRLRIGTDNGVDIELAQLGRWLQERRPVIQLERDCVNACASDLLPAGRALLADSGVLIAFSSMDEWPLLLKQALDDGQLFLTDGGASQAVKDRFIAQYRPFWDRAAAIQTLRAAGVGLPGPAKAFLDRLTRPVAVVSVAFNGPEFNFDLKHSELGCMAWLPDAQGLKQLGLDLPGYQPPSLTEAAKRLKLPAERIYAGAIPDPLPGGPLCRSNAPAQP